MFDMLLSATSVIFSLIILESLLSVDNALVLAAMVKHLPEKARVKALRYGMLGAYGFRGLLLVFVSVLIENPWMKLVAGAYLIYLMCSSLALGEDGEEDSHSAVKKGFVATVVAVELADLMFSIDNIAAAAAFSSHIVYVFIGVAIGIAAMRFVAQKMVKVIERFPILEQIAYVLVGSIGVQLWISDFLHIEISEMGKFASVIAIIVAGLIYDRVPFVNKALKPIFVWIGEVMGNLTELVDSLMKPFKLVFHYTVVVPVKAVFHKVAGPIASAFNTVAAPVVALISKFRKPAPVAESTDVESVDEPAVVESVEAPAETEQPEPVKMSKDAE